MLSCPTELKSFDIAEEERAYRKDHDAWLQGLYFRMALGNVLGNMFSKGGSEKSPYPKEPISSEQYRLKHMTQAEYDNYVLRKMISNEEAFIARQKANGLQEAL